MVKHTQTIRYLTVSDHFVELALKGLNKTSRQNKVLAMNGKKQF